jgi:hypothetical protein
LFCEYASRSLDYISLSSFALAARAKVAQFPWRTATASACFGVEFRYCTRVTWWAWCNNTRVPPTSSVLSFPPKID